MARDVFIKKSHPGLIPQACELMDGLLLLLAARNANWQIVEGWCSVCARSGLHAEPDRCGCACHKARAWLAEQGYKRPADAAA